MRALPALSPFASFPSSPPLPPATPFQEVERWCDLVQFDFVDAYSNVTFDAVSTLKLVAAAEHTLFRRRPDLLLMADDDTYVNVPALWSAAFDEGRFKKVVVGGQGCNFWA